MQLDKSIALLGSMRCAVVVALTSFRFTFGSSVGILGATSDRTLHRVPHATEENGTEEVLERDKGIVDSQKQR